MSKGKFDLSRIKERIEKEFKEDDVFRFKVREDKDSYTVKFGYRKLDRGMNIMKNSIVPVLLDAMIEEMRYIYDKAVQSDIDDMVKDLNQREFTTQYLEVKEND